MRAAIAQPIGRQARRSIARCDKKGEPENVDIRLEGLDHSSSNHRLRHTNEIRKSLGLSIVQPMQRAGRAARQKRDRHQRSMPGMPRLGQHRPLGTVCVMSAIIPIAAQKRTLEQFAFGPQSDIRRHGHVNRVEFAEPPGRLVAEAAIKHFPNGELDSAITLAAAGEGQTPESTKEYLFRLLRRLAPNDDLFLTKADTVEA
jgi:hypothetical protein